MTSSEKAEAFRKAKLILERMPPADEVLTVSSAIESGAGKRHFESCEHWHSLMASGASMSMNPGDDSADD